MTEQFFRFSQLYDTTFMNNSNAVRDEANNRQVMCDEQVGQTSVLLQTVQQVQYLRTNRYVQRRDWLVSYDEFWFHNERSGNTDTLSLTTGELMWETRSKLW